MFMIMTASPNMVTIARTQPLLELAIMATIILPNHDVIAVPIKAGLSWYN